MEMSNHVLTVKWYHIVTFFTYFTNFVKYFSGNYNGKTFSTLLEIVKTSGAFSFQYIPQDLTNLNVDKTCLVTVLEV